MVKQLAANAKLHLNLFTLELAGLVHRLCEWIFCVEVHKHVGFGAACMVWSAIVLALQASSNSNFTLPSLNSKNSPVSLPG